MIETPFLLGAGTTDAAPLSSSSALNKFLSSFDSPNIYASLLFASCGGTPAMPPPPPPSSAPRTSVCASSATLNLVGESAGDNIVSGSTVYSSPSGASDGETNFLPCSAPKVSKVSTGGGCS